MINTSEAYSEYFENASLLGQLRMEVKLSIEDNEFKNSSEANYGDIEYYSDPTYLYQEQRDEYNYATVEKNFWLLDDSQPLISEKDYNKQKMYISNAISDENGNFDAENAPKLTFIAEDLTLKYSSIGLTFTFDDINNNYPKSITVNAYAVNADTLEEELVSSYTVDDIDNYKYLFEQPLNNYNKLEIIFNKTKNGNRRIRINDLVFGILKTYTSKDIIEAEFNEKVDPLSREISEKNFSFTIDNNDLKYNSENPTGINKYLQEKQIISVKMIEQINDNGATETIDFGTYLLDGKPEINKREATFNAFGYNYFGYNNFYKYTYTNSSVSFKKLLELILEDMNLPLDAEGNKRYYIDDSLDTMMCNVPLPLESHKELIKLIAQACFCTVRETKDGYIRIEPNTNVTSNLRIDFNEQTEEPSSELTTKINEIQVKKYSATLEADASEMFTGEYTIDGEEDIHIEWDNPAYEVSVTLPEGFTIVSENYYTYACDLVISTTEEKTGDIIVNGKGISTASTIIKSKNNSATGEIGEIDNKLVSDDTVAKKLADKWLEYSQFRNKYYIECKNKFDLRIEPSDIIEIETQFNDTINVRVTDVSWTYNGGLGGEYKCKSVEN